MDDRAGVNEQRQELGLTDSDTEDHDHLDDVDYPCEWPCCPISDDCQRLRDSRCFLFWMCIASFAQSLAVNGYVSSTITTLERRYGLQSSQLGTIASMYDAGVLTALLPVSYLGGRGRKPRWLAGGMFLIGLGSFVFTLPHFLAGEYRYSTPVAPICYLEEHKKYPNLCKDADTSLQNYRYLFYLGQFLHGIGASPLYTIGIVYIDESSTTHNTGLYLAIFYLMTLLGPAVGFLSGGAFLTLFVDITSSHPGISMQHTSVWVGAWWIGFLITGTLAWTTVIPFLGFPTSLPGSKAIAKKKKNEAFGTGFDSSMGLSGFKRFVASSKLLCTNLTFLFLALCGALEAQLINSLGTFCPKIFEIMFAIPSSKASMTIGYTLVPAGGAAMLIGGLVIKKSNLGIKGILRFSAAGVFIGVIAYLGFFLKCNTPEFHGVNYTLNGYNQNLKMPCNEHCQCQQNKFMFLPTCGMNVNYYSPCFAGCTGKTFLPNGNFEYKNCSCLNQVTTNSSSAFLQYSGGQNVTAANGTCELKDCQIYHVFLVLFSIMVFSTFILVTPSASAVLRVVPANQRAYATGIQWIVIRLLGSIPAPIYVGTLIDQSCALWSKSCESQGACSHYNPTKMYHTILGVFLTVKSLAFVFIFCSLISYRQTPAEETHVVGNGTTIINGGKLDPSTVPLQLHDSAQNGNPYGNTKTIETVLT